MFESFESEEREEYLRCYDQKFTSITDHLKVIDKTKLSYQIQLLQMIKKKIQTKEGLFLFNDFDSDDLISNVSDSFTIESIYKYLYQSKSIKILEFTNNQNYDESIDEFDDKNGLKQEINVNRFEFDETFSLKKFISYSFHLMYFSIKKLYYKIFKMKSQEYGILYSILILAMILLIYFKCLSSEPRLKNYKFKRPLPKLNKIYKILDKVWYLITGLFE
jgi:hypothetical protein